MAISPPGDLVLDVMRAADPRRVQLAAVRLQEMAAPVRAGASADPVAADKWRQAINELVGSDGVVNGATSMGASGPLRLGKAPDARELDADGNLKGVPAAHLADNVPAADKQGGTVAPRAALRQAYAGLEGVLIANMLDGMMGSGRNGLFGGGLAGSYWKSMLAQSIATQVAQGGGLGIGASLLSSTDMMRRG